MALIIRLYRQHDMDLIALYKNSPVKMTTLIKYVIRSYINKKPCLLQYPAATDVSAHNYKSSYQINLRLNQETDKDILEWLETIKKRFRCNTVKNLVRASFLGPYTHPFFVNETEAESVNRLLGELYKNIPCTPLEEIDKVKGKNKKKTSAIKSVSDFHTKKIESEPPANKQIMEATAESGYQQVQEAQQNNQNKEFDNNKETNELNEEDSLSLLNSFANALSNF